MTKAERAKKVAASEQKMSHAQSEWMSSYNQANPISFDQFCKNRGIKFFQPRLSRKAREFRDSEQAAGAASIARAEAEYLEELANDPSLSVAAYNAALAAEAQREEAEMMIEIENDARAQNANA